MTVAMLRQHGVEVDDAEPSRWRVAPGPVVPVDHLIEPDLSNAAPFLALAATTGGSVTVRDWPRSTTQAGDVLRDLLARMGCSVDARPTPGSPSPAADGIEGLDADLHDVGELTPVLAALCALADGPSHLRGIAHIRGHETDRLAALATELRGLGADVTEHADGLELRPATAARRTVPDLRRPPDGARRGGAGLRRRRRRGRRRRRDQQDVPRLPRRVGRPAGPPMSGRYDENDHEHYERPRRRTRPRTKERPTYDDAVEAVVTTVDRGRFTLLVDGVSVWAVKARPLGRKGVVVGDRVRVVGDVSGDDGALARIVEVQERATVLRRTADDDDPVERVVVANADQLVVVTALADPEPRPRLIDRALVAAFVSGMKPLLCLTKADLADPETLLVTYRPLGVPWVVTQRGGDLTELRERLRGRTSVLIGHSGVGKSTLVNALIPDGTPRRRGRERRHRSRTSHLDVGADAGPARRGRLGHRRLDHRHARHPVVRAGPRTPGGPDRGLPRPRRDDGGLSPRLYARRRRAGVRSRRGGRPR